MNNRKWYAGFIVIFLTALLSNVYAVDKSSVINKDTLVLNEKPIITSTVSENPKGVENIATSESFGLQMMITVLVLVLLTLIFLYLIFKITGYLNTSFARRKSLHKQGKTEEDAVINENESGEVFAAIAMALYLYQSQFHDEERTIITMEKVARTYSPWSSKIYGLRHKPNNN
jgi:hypothetical protein